ncbi:MAG: hypothetical protein RBR77_11360 [Thauera sp.]|jgi:hypothetical protein|nr:hypothetical protein [Thauera sp.]
MATNSERQHRYRERALKDPDGHLLTRLQAMIGPAAAGALERMADESGRTKRALIELALVELERRWQDGSVTL